MYVICLTEDFRYYLVEHNIISGEDKKFKFKYVPQCVTVIEDRVVILSSHNNKVFIDTLKDSEINSEEVTEISKLRLDNFMIQTSANKSISDGDNIYFVMSNSDNRDKAYIFNLNYKSLKLEGFKEIKLDNTKYYLYNTIIYKE